MPATATCTRPSLYEPDQLATVDAVAEEIADAALELGGTLTGEHGSAPRSGLRCAAYSARVELAAFRAIKRAFDPDGLLNPRCHVAAAEPRRARPHRLRRRGHDGTRRRAKGSPAAGASYATRHGSRCRRREHEPHRRRRCLLSRRRRCGQGRGTLLPAMESDGVVADAIEVAGHRQPARRALLALKPRCPTDITRDSAARR